MANQFWSNPPVKGGKSSTSYDVGFWGEAFVLLALQHQGWEVRKSSRMLYEQADLTAKHLSTGLIYSIEVKTSLEHVGGHYKFTLWKKGRTDHKKSDVLITVAVTPLGGIYPFVIPIACCRNITVINISSHPTKYKGKWAKFYCPITRLAIPY